MAISANLLRNRGLKTRLQYPNFRPMSDTNPATPSDLPTTTPAAPATTPAAPATPPAPPVDRPEFFSALGNPMRWELVKIMATGKALSASEAAKAVGRDFDGVSKHLRILRRARVVASRRGEDERLKLYYIPEANRRMDGVLDYGFCVIKVG